MSNRMEAKVEYLNLIYPIFPTNGDLVTVIVFNPDSTSNDKWDQLEFTVNDFSHWLLGKDNLVNCNPSLASTFPPMARIPCFPLPDITVTADPSITSVKYVFDRMSDSERVYVFPKSESEKIRLQSVLLLAPKPGLWMSPPVNILDRENFFDAISQPINWALYDMDGRCMSVQKYGLTKLMGDPIWLVPSDGLPVPSIFFPKLRMPKIPVLNMMGFYSVNPRPLTVKAPKYGHSDDSEYVSMTEEQISAIHHYMEAMGFKLPTLISLFSSFRTMGKEFLVPTTRGNINLIDVAGLSITNDSDVPDLLIVCNDAIRNNYKSTESIVAYARKQNPKHALLINKSAVNSTLWKNTSMFRRNSFSEWEINE